MKTHPVVLFLAGLMALALPGLAAPGGDIPQWNGKYTSSEGAYSSKEMWTKIIPNRESWDFLWKKLEKEKPAAFDPAREMAVFIQAGQCPSYGYAVKVLAAYPKDGKYVIEYGVTEPHSMVPQALTYPWVVAVLPRSDLPVVFEKREIH
jgi:hypothetical protein